MKTIKTFFIVLLCSLTMIFPQVAYAGILSDIFSGSNFTAPNDKIATEVQNNFVVNLDDLSSPAAIFGWIRKPSSSIFVRDSQGKPSYYFNTPNIPLSITNSFTASAKGGWSKAAAGKCLDENGNTAEKKYGYYVPTAFYSGEQPALVLSTENIVNDVVNPLHVVQVTFDGIAEGFLKLFNIQYQGKAVNDFKVEYIKDIHYNLNDYKTIYANYFANVAQWLEDHWEDFKYYDDPDTKKQEKNPIYIGGTWLFEDGFIVNEGEHPNGYVIFSRLLDKCGFSTLAVIDSLSEFSKTYLGTPIPQNRVIRNMPYDIHTMDPESYSYMNGIADPRVEQFSSDLPLHIDRSIGNGILSFLNSNWILSWCAGIFQASSVLNSFCDLNFFKKITGMEFFWLWKTPTGVFISIMMMIGSILLLFRQFFKWLIKGESLKKLFSGMIISVVGAGICLSLIAAPEHLFNVLETNVSRIMSIGTVLTDYTSPDIAEFEDSPSQADKSSMRFWYSYFNVWSKYATNHYAKDPGAKFDTSEGTNEYYDFTNTAKIGSKSLDNWTGILYDSLMYGSATTPYRVVDHFMAPVITQGDNYNDFTVSENPYYTGYFYTGSTLSGLLISLIVFSFTFLKLLCFIQLAFDLSFLMIRFAVSVSEGHFPLKDSAMTILLDTLRVMAYDLFVTIALSATQISNNVWFAFILLITSLYLIYGFWKDKNSFFHPVAIDLLGTAMHVVKGHAQTAYANRKTKFDDNPNKKADKQYETDLNLINEDVSSIREDENWENKFVSNHKRGEKHGHKQKQ